MTEPLLMGIDVGTTRIKAGLVDMGGDVIHVESRSTPWQTMTEGPVIDIVETGDLALEVAAACVSRAESLDARVLGVGTTGMAETGALLDEHRNPIAPGYAWHHTLGDATHVQDALGNENFMATTGHGCDLAPSLIKLDYLRSRGHRFRVGQRWFNIPEYVAWRLCGEEACEFSLSGRTALFNLIERRWWDDAFEFLGAGTWLMPGEPQPAGSLVGTVGSDGIPGLASAAVTIAGHDHPVAASSVGALDTGTLCYSLGTSEAQVRIIAPTADRQQVLELVRLGVTVDWHPGGQAWYVLGTLPTGLTLERLAKVLGCDTTAQRLELSTQALDAPQPPGARLQDVTLDSFSITGITTGDSRASVWRQAVAQLLVNSSDLRDSVSRVIGAPQHEIVLGGWIHDPLMARERGRMGQHPTKSSPREPGILGAALAAAKACGFTQSLRDALPSMVPGQPGPDAAARNGQPTTKE